MLFSIRGPVDGQYQHAQCVIALTPIGGTTTDRHHRDVRDIITLTRRRMILSRGENKKDEDWVFSRPVGSQRWQTRERRGGESGEERPMRGEGVQLATNEPCSCLRATTSDCIKGYIRLN